MKTLCLSGDDVYMNLFDDDGQAVDDRRLGSAEDADRIERKLCRERPDLVDEFASLMATYEPGDGSEELAAEWSWGLGLDRVEVCRG